MLIEGWKLMGSDRERERTDALVFSNQILLTRELRLLHIVTLPHI